MNFRLSRIIRLFCTLVFAAGVSAAETKPNLIFILADDLGYGDLGSFGQTLS
jgi:arylsulfatase A